MFVASRKEMEETTALAHELATASKKGIPLTKLSSRLILSIDRIEWLLRRHPEYFLKVGTRPSYRLNQFSKFNGSVEDVLIDIERSYERTKYLQATGILGAVVGSLAAVTALIMSS